MRQHKLFWGSSYDRGLNVLLKMWAEIKRTYPDAELHCAYGWDLFDRVTVNNAERQAWKAKMLELMKQPGVTEHGRLSKADLKKLRQECGILAYCSDFTEIFCITAMECQADGVVPVTTDLAALPETVKGGVLVKGDIYDPDTKKKYLQELLSLMGDRERWQSLQKIGRDHAENFSWGEIAMRWEEEFPIRDEQDIKVSIITPTIRRGWWNIMAHNISNQTYKNIEWVIVDDYPTNRREVAAEYAEKYNLNITYTRGKRRAQKRTYGLVNANNTALQAATGELLVILQDFVLMPEDGIEDLVNLYRRNPDALIAPVDRYFKPRLIPDTESEDWFHGKTDVIGEFMRQNIRIQNLGMRFSDHPYDFEQNYGAVPKHIADDLGGWYEFYDEGLGFDNTEFAYRALSLGYKLIVDDTNVATCIDHWNALEGTAEHGLGRERRLSDPRFLWEMQMLKEKKLPLRRTQELDDTIELLYEMPADVPDSGAVDWMRANTENIVVEWLKKYKDL